MKVKIAFDPANIKPGDEAYPAFSSGYPVVLRIWALYKKHFITSQHFRECLIEFNDMMFKALSHENPDCHMYVNIDDFMAWMRICGFYNCLGRPGYNEFRDWAVKYWDYFNPSIQRQVSLVYEATEVVEKEYQHGNSSSNRKV